METYKWCDQNVRTSTATKVHVSRQFFLIFLFWLITDSCIELRYNNNLLWGYCWGSTQTKTIYSLQHNCYWLNTPLNQSWDLWWVIKDWTEWDWDQTSIKVCVHVSVFMCVYLATCVLCACTWAMCVCKCYFPCPWVKSGPFGGALRTARERNHTHSHKQSNQFVYQTQHLMVICECV